MRLYHHPLSSNARRAAMTAVHLGTKIELVTVDLGKGEHRSPEFLRMNPNGRVPVLDDEGFLLTESHAIIQYLADKAQSQTVYPEEKKARADVNRWLFWSAQHFQPAIGVLNWEHFVKPFIGAGPPDPKEVERGERLVTECARVLDAHLAGKRWVSQDRLTLADLALAPALAVTESAKLPVKQYENIQRWFDRVRELDAWKKTGM